MSWVYDGIAVILFIMILLGFLKNFVSIVFVKVAWKACTAQAALIIVLNQNIVSIGLSILLLFNLPVIYLQRAVWSLPKLLCPIKQFLVSVLLSVSILNYTLLALERKAALQDPQKACRTFSQRNIRKYLGMIWLIVIVFFGQHLYYFEGDGTRCTNFHLDAFFWKYLVGISFMIFLALAITAAKSFINVISNLSKSAAVSLQQIELQKLILAHRRRFIWFAISATIFFFCGYFISVYVVYVIQILTLEVPTWVYALELGFIEVGILLNGVLGFMVDRAVLNVPKRWFESQ
ncbi:hypothetical protein Ddc_15181 [Ditylenchus destructor]|nr:hypothetical protein Ddc_15181 [Ditylenchus destructor]